MPRNLILILLALLLTAGCGSNDDRLVNMAQDHEKRQAEQNQRMAELQNQVAEGSKRLVEADAESREKFLAIQDNLRADQAAVGQQRDKLEVERREIAAQRIRDPIIAASIVQIGLWLACLLPLILAGYLVYAMRETTNQDDAIVAEFLVTDIAAEHPLLLGPPTSPEPLQLPKPETTEPEPAAT
jgi:hypothetical protein